MKNITKKIIFIVLLLLVTTLSFSNKTPQTNNEEEQNTGFLYNIRELKEMSDIMDIVSENYVGDGTTIDKKTLLHGALKGMVDSLGDPHSNYFTAKEMEDFNEDIKGKYHGVGMIIQKKPDEPLLVVSPIEDTPAYRAGIKPKDKILAINGESTLSLTSEESAKKLKGEPGTSVKLTVYREKIKETKELELKRETIQLNYVKSKMLVNNIGYLRLTQFGQDVTKDVEKALKKLKKDEMQGLIFDLRSNPGGSLDEAIKISSLFVKEDKIVSTKRKDGQEEIGKRSGNYLGDFPLVILVNEGSASASEIVSGAVKDYKRGTLVGTKTFGKGSVQTVVPLPDGDGIKLTIAKYYTPSGTSIHGVGIEPDVKVEEDESYMLFDGMITNIDEEAQKESKKAIIKEVKGEKEAKEFEEKVDYQLDKGIEIISKQLNKNYVAKINPKILEKDKVKGKDEKSSETKESTVEKSK